MATREGEGISSHTDIRPGAGWRALASVDIHLLKKSTLPPKYEKYLTEPTNADLQSMDPMPLEAAVRWERRLSEIIDKFTFDGILDPKTEKTKQLWMRMKALTTAASSVEQYETFIEDFVTDDLVEELGLDDLTKRYRSRFSVRQLNLIEKGLKESDNSQEVLTWFNDNKDSLLDGTLQLNSTTQQYLEAFHGSLPTDITGLSQILPRRVHWADSAPTNRMSISSITSAGDARNRELTRTAKIILELIESCVYQEIEEDD